MLLKVLVYNPQVNVLQTIMEAVDTELTHLNISEQLRANSSFMKIMATLFHYGNQAMNAAQLVIAVRALNLLPLR